MFLTNKLLVIACVCLALGSAAFGGTLSWENQPIMGVNVDASVPGQLTIDTNPVLITIPQYNGPDPSMTVFVYNPVVCCSSGYLYDPSMYVWAASAVNVDPSSTYQYTGVWSFLGTPGNPAYDITFPQDTWGASAFSVAELYSSVGQFWDIDAGPWRYTETWTGTGGLDQGASITSTRDFELVPTPEPTSVLLLVSGSLCLAWLRKRGA
jgi:hypothetical protein